MTDPDADGCLFDINKYPTRPLPVWVSTLQRRVWTASKAQLIQRYLKLFVMITHHGYYIDAFAGPQNENRESSWAAKQVLEMTPKWFRKFTLCEIGQKGLACLRELKEAEAKGDNRPVDIVAGDSNTELPRYLAANPTKEKMATFCLLDQRTTECDWATVQAVAQHKQAGHKVEIFYFLPSWWFERCTKNLKNPDVVLKRWTGLEDWRPFVQAKRKDRPWMLVERFKQELGYKHANYYPIYEDAKSSKVMFYMIHGTDHDAAPQLMSRAYNGTEALGTLVTQEECDWVKTLALSFPSQDPVWT